MKSGICSLDPWQTGCRRSGKSLLTNSQHSMALLVSATQTTPKHLRHGGAEDSRTQCNSRAKCCFLVMIRYDFGNDVTALQHHFPLSPHRFANLSTPISAFSPLGNAARIPEVVGAIKRHSPAR